MFRVALDDLPAWITDVHLGVPATAVAYTSRILQDIPLPRGVVPHVHGLEPTRDQVETLAELALYLRPGESVYCRDADSAFRIHGCDQLWAPLEAFVACGNAGSYPDVSLAGKCFAIQGPGGSIASMIEKQVVSPFFGVGGYFFTDVLQLEWAVGALGAVSGERYPSMLINALLERGDPVLMRPVDHYLDMGTQREWMSIVERHGTLFVDLDGVLLSCTDRTTRDQAAPLRDNIEAVHRFQLRGGTVVVTTARPKDELRGIRMQLSELGLSPDHVLCGLGRGPRMVVNDSGNSNTGQLARSLTIPRDNETLLPEVLG